ncbi:hypothetical protein [Cohnella kolymensis]|uniref:hypothetical protein n=1 Tax=Cohnella kolymensis TaxID=1590652 RepID=UPI0013EE8887|nr:hypothetical protein [Cohnella kolymensis]
MKDKLEKGKKSRIYVKTISKQVLEDALVEQEIIWVERSASIGDSRFYRLSLFVLCCGKEGNKGEAAKMNTVIIEKSDDFQRDSGSCVAGADHRDPAVRRVKKTVRP